MTKAKSLAASCTSKLGTDVSTLWSQTEKRFNDGVSGVASFMKPKNIPPRVGSLLFDLLVPLENPMLSEAIADDVR